MTPLDDPDPQRGPLDPGHADPTVDPGASTTIDWESDDNPYKGRLNDYRSKVADPKITRLSQYEQAVQDFQTGDPNAMRQAAAVLGISDYLDIEDPEPPTYDDPLDELRAQLAAESQARTELEGRLTKREQAEQEQAQAAAIGRALDGMGITDEQERNVVLGTAFTLPTSDDGMPDLKAAVALVEARDKAREQAWRQGKRVPASIAPGQTATQQRAITDMLDATGQLTQEGLDYLAQRAENTA